MKIIKTEKQKAKEKKIGGATCPECDTFFRHASAVCKCNTCGYKKGETNE